MTRIKSLIRCIAFVLAALFCIKGAIRILVPKNYTGEWLSPVPSYCGFYELKKDTVDVLFLGSSHTYASFCPQVLYDEYGITSYNMGMGNQNLILSYYWLKEALRTQSPSAVVVESVFAFSRCNNPSNSLESATQKSLNYMHWTRNRVDAIKAFCETEPELYSWESFIPNLRYHDRWKELHEEDFTFGEIASRNQLMGYSGAFRYYCQINDYEPYSITDETKEMDAEEMVPAMEEYLDKIVELCRERKIRLILALTPSTSTTLSMHIGLQKYADQQGVEVLDYNTEDMIREMEYEFGVHNSDDEHPSIWGAQKITLKLGEYLTKQDDPASSSLQPHQDAQWENSRSYYENAIRDAELMHKDSIYEYLSALGDDRYSVFICVKGEASSSADEQIAGLLQDLGLKEDLKELGGDSYFAVIDAGKVLSEARGTEEIYSTGSIRNGRTIYEIDSKGSNADSQTYGYSSIIVNGKELSVNKQGINIAVLKNESTAVIDKVCYHTGGDLKAER